MEKPLMLISCPASSRSGYGHHSRDLIRSLISLDKFDIKIMDLRWGETPRNVLKMDNPKDKIIIDRLLNSPQLPKQPEIYINISVPNEFQPIGKYNIGITAGIETTMCSPDWINGINRMDLVIVPSKHSKDVFLKTIWTERENVTNKPIRQLKVEKPIEILFEGFDPDVYKKMYKGDEFPLNIVNEMKNVDTHFNFLYVGHWLKGDIGEDRKNVSMLIKTFLEAFRNTTNPPGLILKTSGATFSVMDRESILDKIHAIKKTVSGNLPPIYLLHGDLTDEEMNALYNHPKIKVHINFSKGEGFCRPLLEASISGKPIVASGWSGHLDFLSKELAVLLPGHLSNVHKSAVWDKVIIPESQWFTVNYNYAIETIKHIYKDYNKYENNSLKLSEINKSKFNLNRMTVDFGKILDKYLPTFPSTNSTINLPNLPKLKKIDSAENIPSSNIIKIPKLKQINTGD